MRAAIKALIDPESAFACDTAMLAVALVVVIGCIASQPRTLRTVSA